MDLFFHVWAAVASRGARTFCHELSSDDLIHGCRGTKKFTPPPALLAVARGVRADGHVVRGRYLGVGHDGAEPRLGFIGFVRPNVGAIPPMAELQAMWWLERVRGRCAGPSRGAWGRHAAT